jgi:hypothetical protein
VKLLFKDGNAARTMMVWTASFSQTFIYYGIVLYLPRAFLVLVDDRHQKTALMPTAYPYWALFASCGGELLANFLALFFVQIYSRSKLMSFFFACFALTFPVIIMDVPDVIMVAFAMLARLCATIAGNLTWLVSPEAYPTQVRATGHSWANLAARAGALVTTYWASYHDKHAVFVGYSVVAIVASIASFMLPPGVMPGSNPNDVYNRRGDKID